MHLKNRIKSIVIIKLIYAHVMFGICFITSCTPKPNAIEQSVVKSNEVLFSICKSNMAVLTGFYQENTVKIKPYFEVSHNLMGLVQQCTSDISETSHKDELNTVYRQTVESFNNMLNEDFKGFEKLILKVNKDVLTSDFKAVYINDLLRQVYEIQVKILHAIDVG